MQNEKPNLDQFFDLPNPGLRAYFAHTESGNQDDYRPPFWKGKSRQSVLDDWQKVFDTLGVKEKYPGLYDFEMDMKSKVGPLSIQQPLKNRMESIKSYYAKRPSVPISKDAIHATCKQFGKAGGIRLRSLESTAANMRLNTNSGVWKFTKRRRVLDETLKAKIRSDGKTMTITSHGKEYRNAAILGWRGQEGGIHDDDVKQRVVFMCSFVQNVHELRFYQPAIQAFQKHNLIPAFVSMDAVDREITKLFATKNPNDVVVCTDFTKFDQHFNSDMQNAAAEVINYLAPSAKQWLEEVFPLKFYVPLICSEQIMFTGPHGMGSGSGGTNFDECMAHKALQHEAALSHGQKLNPHSMAYGDDGIITYTGVTVEQVIETYTKHGQEMNDQKQYVSTHDCIFLRRWHSTSYTKDGVMVGVYSTFRALGRLLGQERFYDPDVWGPQQVTLRAWSIIENCNHSPYFEQFVDFVIKGDKFRLGLDIPGFIDNIVEVAKKSIDQLPDFMGYTKTLQNTPEDIARGIKGWRIYQYLVHKKEGAKHGN
nr:MAG: RNA-dependent RNA polymerase [Porcine picobirnavirus]